MKKCPQDASPKEAPVLAIKGAETPCENEDTARPQNPFLNASVISKLLFKWPFPLMKLGMQRPIEESDIPDILQAESSVSNLNMLESIWGEEKARTARLESSTARPSLHKAILRNYFSSIWYVQPLMLASSTAKIVQALALGLLLETFESKENGNQGYLWAGVLVICGAVVLFEHHHVFFITWRKGMQLRIASVAAIYAKTLRLRSTARVEAGRVMNIASNDVERFLLAALFISYMFWAPAQSIAILILGVKLLGPAFVAGYGLLVCLFVPLQFYLSKRFATLRSKVAAITDSRVTMLSQAIAGVRVMKVSAWENEFEKRIARIRAEEVSQIRRANNLKALNEAVFFSTNVIISIVIFLVHIALGGHLTPRNVYTTMTLVNIVQIEMTKHLSLAVMGVSEAFVSISRIQKFLEYPELSSSTVEQGCDSDNDGSTALTCQKATCYWNGEKNLSDSKISKNEDVNLIVALENITLRLGLAAGELVCVIGSVGAGKSALLQMLAGELEVASGSIKRSYNSLAYASQDPWLIDGSVKENITMGKPFDESWYGSVVNACGLRTDFEQFTNGDLTIVGDRGVQCSGGQRARIGLARALFRDADMLLLDDPLSAVDAKVGRTIFYCAILNLAVKRGKCVVLATHQHQFISESRCILMANGRVECDGTYAECVSASGGKLTKSAHNAEDELHSNDAMDARGSDTSTTLTESTGNFENKFTDNLGTTNAKSSKDNEEMKAQGVVRMDTFITYARAMGGLTVALFLLFAFSVTQASVLGTIAVLGIWSEQPPEKQKTASIMGIVIGLGAGVVILALVRAFGSFALTIKASRALHDQMTASVFRAKCSFFDTNPLVSI